MSLCEILPLLARFPDLLSPSLLPPSPLPNSPSPCPHSPLPVSPYPLPSLLPHCLLPVLPLPSPLLAFASSSASRYPLPPPNRHLWSQTISNYVCPTCQSNNSINQTNPLHNSINQPQSFWIIIKKNKNKKCTSIKTCCNYYWVFAHLLI